MKLKIAYQGVAGAYSYIAAQTVFPNQEYLSYPSFEEAFKAVVSSTADYAIIPVENSNAGRVTDVHFLLPQTGLYIIDEFFLRIEHQLLGLPQAKLSDIKSAFSHPQALAQCSQFLKEHQIHPIQQIDTALSCQDILQKGDLSQAAIASSAAAEIYGLKVLASNIENAANNTTRFLIMSRNNTLPHDNGGKFITSFIFKTRNIPASLYKALGGFATNDINITKLESYLLDGKFVSAQFYVEAETHPERLNFKNALEELKFYAQEWHILGTYQAHPYRYL